MQWELLLEKQAESGFNPTLLLDLERFSSIN